MLYGGSSLSDFALSDVGIQEIIAADDIQHSHTLEGGLFFILQPADLVHVQQLESTNIGARVLSAAQKTDAAAEGISEFHLMEMHFHDGTVGRLLRLTTAGTNVDVTIDGMSMTFLGTGSVLNIGTIEETADRKQQGVPLSVSGLDNSILDPLLNGDFRGRSVKIWRVFFDDATGLPSSDPILFGRFQQLSEYDIQYDPPKGEKPGTFTIETRVQSPISAMQRLNSVRTNVESHNRMLERAGVTLNETDTFFWNLPELIGREIRWGSGDTPDRATTSSGGETGGSDAPTAL